jgi:hypothetical protein
MTVACRTTTVSVTKRLKKQCIYRDRGEYTAPGILWEWVTKTRIQVGWYTLLYIITISLS